MRRRRAGSGGHLVHELLRAKLQVEAGILARVVGLFSGRGYNIESLTVAPVDEERRQSRVTIVTTGTAMVIEQIKAQLDRLVPVHRIADLTLDARWTQQLDGTLKSPTVQVTGGKLHAIVQTSA